MIWFWGLKDQSQYGSVQVYLSLAWVGCLGPSVCLSVCPQHN